MTDTVILRSNTTKKPLRPFGYAQGDRRFVILNELSEVKNLNLFTSIYNYGGAVLTAALYLSVRIPLEQDEETPETLRLRSG